jgi:hypothetical protein
MATRAARTGPRWLRRTVTLSRNQLYWYETRRAEAEGTNLLADFLAEYPTDPDEAFQYSGRTIFPISVLEGIQHQQRPQVDTWAVQREAIIRSRLADS